MNYDLVILCHPKDYVKLEFCINSCLEFFNPKPEGIYIVSPDRVELDGLIHVHDDKAIAIKKEDIKYRRPNWIFKMFVNLFQDFTQNDLYMTVDADVIFNRPQELFKDGKPVFFISDREQHHLPYFHFMDMWSGLEKQVSYTFINDYMMMDKGVCREMLPDIRALLDFCNKDLSEDCLLADYEMYGNFATWTYPDMYETVHTKTQLNGKYVQNPWTREEINKLVKINTEKDIDLFTMHSWT